MLLDKIIQKLKNIYFIVSIIMGILIVFFTLLDFLLFNFYFHFSFATYKDFYLDSFDIGISNLLILFALVPILLALLFFLIPASIVRFVKWVVDKLKLEKSIFTLIAKNTKISILFMMYFLISYFLIGLIVFYLLNSLLDSSVNLFLIVVAYIGLLTASFFYSIITFNKNFFGLICLGLITAINVLIFLFINDDIYKQILLILLLFIFIPLMMIMFLISMQEIEQKRDFFDLLKKPVEISILLFVVFIGTIYFANEINKDTWVNYDIAKSNLNNFSLNLMLNKTFLVKNHKLIDLDVSDDYGYGKECINNNILFNKDSNVTVLSLSKENKLYFRSIKKYTVCIYAIKVLKVKGKDVYNLVDVVYIENIKEK